MNVNLTVVAQTQIGLRRQLNEDALMIADLTDGRRLDATRVAKVDVGRNGMLLAVSDGTGGSKAGGEASALVVESLRRGMARPFGRPDERVLEAATQQANREVWLAGQSPGHERMGATLTAVFIHDETAHIAEVGDSRAYLVRGGDVQQVTRDQTCVQIMLENGALNPQDAKRARFSSVLLQTMGLRDGLQVGLGRLDLRQGDCLVLCSDGLSSVVSADEIGRVVCSGELRSACATLVGLAMKRGGDDDVTVIVAKVSGDLPPVVAGEGISNTLVQICDFDLRPRIVHHAAQ